jgi:hypothetical protein
VKTSDNNEVRNFDDNDYDDSNDNDDNDDGDDNNDDDDNDNDKVSSFKANQIDIDNKYHHNENYMECKAIVKSLNELGLMSQLPNNIRIGLLNSLVSTQNHESEDESVKSLVPPLDDELAFFSAIKFNTNENANEYANTNASSLSLTLTPDDELAYLDQLDFRYICVYMYILIHILVNTCIHVHIHT